VAFDFFVCLLVRPTPEVRDVLRIAVGMVTPDHIDGDLGAA
jgi:hypothetical protein